jgi:hypothetical protein
MIDDYTDGTCRWWHLSRPSPELVAALDDGWLPSCGRPLDIGCGPMERAAVLSDTRLLDVLIVRLSTPADADPPA